MKRVWIGMILLGIFGCEPVKPAKKDAKDPAKTFAEGFREGLSNISTEYEELSMPAQAEAWVSKLIVKAQPGKEMPQIGTLNQGEKVEYLYQRTIRRTEFTLRGQRFYEPWILIRTQGGQVGWVHQGGVRFIEPEVEPISTGPVTQTSGPQLRSTSTPQPNNKQDWYIIPGKRIGRIDVKTSEEDLMRMYGPANVERGEVKLSTAQKSECTIIFGDTPDELRITWKDNRRESIQAIYVDNPKAKWHTPQNLKVGLNLLELTKFNQAPVEFYGFNWEYSGTINSWKGGILKQYGEKFYAVLSPRNPDAAKEYLKDFNGKQLFTSNTEGVGLLGLYVSRIVVYLD